MNDNKEISLNSISVGDKATVKSLKLCGEIKRRLQDLGIIEGTNIECILKSPWGDPGAYLIRGAVIALRNDISSKIIINTLEV